MKKDNSTTDLDSNKNTNVKLLSNDQNESNSYYNGCEEKKSEKKRTGSLHRYNSNSLLQKDSKSPIKKH